MTTWRMPMKSIREWTSVLSRSKTTIGCVCIHADDSLAELAGSGEPRRAEPVAGPVGRAQARDRHPGRFVGGVHELAVADIDPVVAQTGGVRVLEEDQITRLQLIARRV